MARKFFIKETNGDIFEISELDFNNIKGRIARGQTKGWYSQRGEAVDRHDWRIQFENIGAMWSDKPPKKDIPVRNIDVKKHLPPDSGETKKLEPKVKDEKCHDWNNPETWEHVTVMVNGNNRYHKMCHKCHAKSQIVKKREVELAQEAKGLTIDDVPLVQ